MKDLWGPLMGLLHIIVHPDSSFATLGMAKLNSWPVILLIVLFSSFSVVVLYFFNKQGLALASRRQIKLLSKIRQISSGVIKKFGYLGLVVLCLIPYLPTLKEASLLSGQMVGLKYTLPIVLIFNAVRLITLSSLFC